MAMIYFPSYTALGVKLKKQKTNCDNSLNKHKYIPTVSWTGFRNYTNPHKKLHFPDTGAQGTSVAASCAYKTCAVAAIAKGLEWGRLWGSPLYASLETSQDTKSVTCVPDHCCLRITKTKQNQKPVLCLARGYVVHKRQSLLSQEEKISTFLWHYPRC